jgi:LuxR family transcriptional regulator, maltose regulon positive regulatory protein
MISKPAGLRETFASPPLVVTKLHPPVAREQNVVRDRLMELLRPQPGVKLTVVAAPAGSGKTTLLGMWRDAEATVRPVAWVTLDEGDNDPVVLWMHVLEALRQVCPAVGDTTSPEQVGAARIAEVLLPQLVNHLSENGDVALILDDFDRLSSGASRDTLAWLIEHSPSPLQVVVASRNEPGLPLGALRAHGELLELRADDLRFTAEEAEALLNERLALGLARADVDRLVERTEGWPAGIYLAALSLVGVHDRGAFVSQFGGANRYVIDFLVDEVLEAHSPATQALMLRSSILDRVSGPLCDAVLEQDGAGERLSELSRSNLFLVPLDDRDEWFRFHHLFAQLLRVELEHREPGLAPTLHRRAYVWHRDNGLVDQAIEHALQAGAFAEANELIAERWLHALNLGRHQTVLAWLDRFPPELADESSRLLLMRAWVLSFCLRHDEANDVMDALEWLGWPDESPLPDGSSSLEASLATIRAAFPLDDVGAGYENALRAAELESPDSPFWADVCWPLGLGYYNRGDLARADRWFAEAAAVGRENERWLVAASAVAYRSLIAGERGDLHEQRLLAEQADRLARERGVDRLKGEVHVAMGESVAAGGELDQALPILAHGVSVQRRFGSPVDLANALISQARVLQSMDRSEDAAAAIDEARDTIEPCVDPGVLPERLEALTRPRRARRRTRQAELTERELVVLRMLTGPLSERDIGRELYLSYNTIHSHTRSIFRKLGASSRAEAVRRARSLTLL